MSGHATGGCRRSARDSVRAFGNVGCGRQSNLFQARPLPGVEARRSRRRRSSAESACIAAALGKRGFAVTDILRRRWISAICRPELRTPHKNLPVDRFVRSGSRRRGSRSQPRAGERPSGGRRWRRDAEQTCRLGEGEAGEANGEKNKRCGSERGSSPANLVSGLVEGEQLVGPWGATTSTLARSKCSNRRRAWSLF